MSKMLSKKLNTRRVRRALNDNASYGFTDRVSGKKLHHGYRGSNFIRKSTLVEKCKMYEEDIYEPNFQYGYEYY